MILDIPYENIELLRQLKTKYRIFLLSNTNQIHLDKYTLDVKRAFDIDSLDVLFEKTYYSHEMNMRKPNLDIYESVLVKSNLVAEETLFIDDSEENIKAAKKTGIQAYHLKQGETIVELFGYSKS